MAVNRFTGAVSANSNVAGNWSLGVVPTQADGHVATWDSSSPNCTINATLSCNNIDCSTYTNTITVNTPLVLETFGTMSTNSGSTITGTGIFYFRANSTLTSNGGEISTTTVGTGNVSRTTTLIGNAKFGRVGTNGGTWTINKTTNEKLILTAGSAAGGAGLFLRGDITEVQMKGVFNVLDIYLPVRINGDITFSRSTFRNNFIYDSGVITVAKNNIINLKSGYQLKLPPYNMANIFIAESGTTTLLDNIICDNFIIDTSIDNIIFNNYSINCGSLISKLTTGTFSGSTIFNLNGLGISSSNNVSNTINIATPTENIFTGAVSSSWSVAGNWSLGTAPTASDGYLTRFDSSSPNCTVNTSTINCNAVSFSGYTNTLTMSNTLNNYGNCTLSNTMNIAGVGTLVQSSSGLFTSNGKTWSSSFTLSNNLCLIILSGDWTNSGIFSITSSIASAINKTTNEKLILNGGLTMSGSISGTAQIQLAGGTWSGAGVLNSELDFNGNCTVSGSVNKGVGAITRTSGAITTTGSTITFSQPCTPTVSGVTWNNLVLTPTTFEVLLTSDLNILGTLTLHEVVFTGNYNIYCVSATCNYQNICVLSGNIFCSETLFACAGNTGPEIQGFKITAVNLTLQGNNTIALGGTTLIEISGGVWSGLSQVRTNLTLDNVEIVGNVRYASSVLKLIGNTTGTGVIEIVTNCNIDGQNFTLMSLFLTTTNITVFLNSDLKIQGAFTSIASTVASHNTIKSNLGGTQRKLTFLSGSNMDFSFVDGIDIDSSDGLPVFTYKGTLTNTKNWNQFKLFNAPSSNIFMIN